MCVCVYVHSTLHRRSKKILQLLLRKKLKIIHRPWKKEEPLKKYFSFEKKCTIDLSIQRKLPLSFREVPPPPPLFYISARVVFNTFSRENRPRLNEKSPFPRKGSPRLSRYPYYPIHTTENVRLRAPVCLCMRVYRIVSTLTFTNIFPCDLEISTNSNY